MKFHEVTPTKSGRSVVDIWNDLQLHKQLFKKAKLIDDEISMVNNAVLIQELEDDLGLTITLFPILVEMEKK